MTGTAGHPGITGLRVGGCLPDCYARDQWVALRRDTHRFLAAGTLDELATGSKPTTQRPGTPRLRPARHRRTTQHPRRQDRTREVPGRDGEKLRLLMGLRATFPHWAISYSPYFRAWTARNDDTTICENSPALLVRPPADRAPGPARPRPGPDPRFRWLTR